MSASSVFDEDEDELAPSTTTSIRSDDVISEQQVELARKETRVVSLFRLAVIAVLIIATVLVSVGVYLYTSRQETNEFESQFKDQSDKVIEAFYQNIEKKLDALSTFSYSLTGYALSQGETWPFVTLPNFELQGRSAMINAEALSTSVIPVISEEDRAAWEDYVPKHADWIKESQDYQEGLEQQLHFGSFGSDRRLAHSQMHQNDRSLRELQEQEPVPLNQSSGINDKIWEWGQYGAQAYEGTAPYFPLWQNAPLLPTGNENVETSAPPNGKGYKTVMSKKAAALGDSNLLDNPRPGQEWVVDITLFMIRLWYGNDIDLSNGDAVGVLYYPIFDTFDEDAKVVAILNTFYFWRGLFLNLLPNNAKGIIAVFGNTCNQTFTYKIDGASAEYLGVGDLHDPRYDYMEQSATLIDEVESRGTNTFARVPLVGDHCEYTLTVYPSQAMKDEYVTPKPIVFTVVVVAIFLFTAALFLAYDWFVEHRQRLVMRKALQSGAIVSSLFPKAIQDRLMERQKEEQNKGKGDKNTYLSQTGRVKSFLNQEGDEDGQPLIDEKPIADLFPHTTVMFADITGFTAWSSSREPAQVFILLQTVYQAFDVIAKRRKVFKVETVGDCYIACAGLPEPQPTHAVMMARFAQECLFKMNELTPKLEVTLGPDTGDLAMRCGLHSGPVTAGVLRGDKSRFQLFGDTVNTAARMESTGARNRIQISQATADLLIAAGKGNWVKPRDHSIDAKGLGVIQSCWLIPISKYAASRMSNSSGPIEVKHAHSSKESTDLTSLKTDNNKQERLIDWNTEVLLGHLRKIVARREAKGIKQKKSAPELKLVKKEGAMALDEVKEIIELPSFDPELAEKESDPRRGTISPVVITQMRSYVAAIARTYHSNPFHNFEHASHVALSVDKFLQRVTTPELDLSRLGSAKPAKQEMHMHQEIASGLHEYTHGITSDPLTHFSIVLSALIHDADHQGISNGQLIKENPVLGELYREKSVAEQNSVDLAWDLLMLPKYKELRSCIYADMKELQRFRQTVVQVVLATDIFDKELNDLRKNRWKKAFSKELCERPDSTPLKATIVIEHIIQASDVSHTMQHWWVYRKWNERLFHEMYQAFRADRMGADPSTFWYTGELGFFDNYIIPLAKKLKECNVFGVSSDECLNYAMQNRREWEVKGERIVKDMLALYETPEGIHLDKSVHMVISEGEDGEEEEEKSCSSISV